MTTRTPKPPTIGLAARLITHPLRRQLLQHYAEHEASPSDLADRYQSGHLAGKARSRHKIAGMGPIGNVSYHTRILHAAGAIRLTRTKQVRGAIEHYYRADTPLAARALELVKTWDEGGTS